MKCVDWDFTVIPYIIFVMKFMIIIIEQIKRVELKSIITEIYIGLVGYVLVAKIGFWVIRRVYHVEKDKE